MTLGVEVYNLIRPNFEWSMLIFCYSFLYFKKIVAQGVFWACIWRFRTHDEYMLD